MQAIRRRHGRTGTLCWLTNERTVLLQPARPLDRRCPTAVDGDDRLGEGIDCSAAAVAQNNKPSSVLLSERTG